MVEKQKNNLKESREKRKEMKEGKPEKESREKESKEERKAEWVPKTELGKAVKAGKINRIEEIFEKELKVMEPEIIDYLTSVKADFLAIGQSKGKFGGGKRRIWRQTQRKTAEGNVPSFACLAVVGNEEGFVGLGYGKAKETLPAKEKAIRKAKMQMIKVNRGCGSFDCGCGEKHSIPFKVEGKVGSTKIVLIPAPKGTGLVIDDECKKIMKLAGIKDIYSKTYGQTRTKFNLAKACMKALEKTTALVKSK